MKAFTTVAAALAIFAPAVLAQIGSVPSCANPCISSLITGSNCGTNIGCICGNSTLISNLSCCVKQNCNAAEGQQAVGAANGICKAGGVSNLPQSPSCASTAAGVTSTGSSGASATDTSSHSTGPISPIRPQTLTSTSPAQSSVLSSLNSELSSAASSASSAASSAASAGSSAASSAAAPTSSSNAAPTALPGVAGVMVGAAAGFLGLVL